MSSLTSYFLFSIDFKSHLRPHPQLFLHPLIIISNELKQMRKLKHHDPDQNKAFTADKARKAVTVWCSATEAIFMLSC